MVPGEKLVLRSYVYVLSMYEVGKEGCLHGIGIHTFICTVPQRS
jgi:hypothetical protein